MFKEGEVVKHIWLEEYLLVLDPYPGNDMVLCRTKDYQAILFHQFELTKI